MSLPPLLTQADLELFMGGVGTVAQFLDDANTGSPDPTIVTYVIQKASDEGAGALRSAFTNEQIVDMVARDTTVKDRFCAIAAGMSGARRPKIRDDRGRTMWFDERQSAWKFLKELAKADNRSVAEGEGTVPENPLIEPETNFRQPIQFEFAPTSAFPRRGGGF